MKKVILITLGIVMVLGLMGCGKPETLSEDSDVKITKINYTLPEGFVALADGQEVFVSGDYPVDQSKITFSKGTKTENFDKITDKELEESYRKEATVNGKATALTMDSFERGKIDNFRTIKTKITLNYTDKNVVMEQLLIDGDETHIITFLSTGDTDWTPAYEEMIKSIKIEHKKNK